MSIRIVLFGTLSRISYGLPRVMAFPQTSGGVTGGSGSCSLGISKPLESPPPRTTGSAAFT